MVKNVYITKIYKKMFCTNRHFEIVRVHFWWWKRFSDPPGISKGEKIPYHAYGYFVLSEEKEFSSKVSNFYSKHFTGSLLFLSEHL